MKEESSADKAFENLLAAKLQQQLRTDPSECPDPETLAGYFDHVLTAAERETCETHVSGCARCQESLAEIARLSEAAEAPVVVAAEEAPGAEEARATGWHFNLAWAGLVLVLVVAVGVWQQDKVLRFLRPERETAENVAPPAAVSPPQPAASMKTRPVPPPRPEIGKDKGVSTGLAMARKAAVAEAHPAAAAPAASHEAAAQGAMATPTQRAAVGGVVQPGGGQFELRAEGPNLQMAERDTADRALGGNAPPPSSALARAAKAEARGDQATAALAAPKIVVQGATTAYSPKWRVGRRGVIQKADPNGNWITVPSGVTSDLFDITFAGPMVGWAVGHGGLVLRTTDGGNTWVKTDSPSSDDLMHVSASSDLAARVITRGNKLYSTNDGGNTWTTLSQE